MTAVFAYFSHTAVMFELREIAMYARADGWAYRGKASKRMLDAMKDAGWITYDPTRERHYRITEAGRAHLQAEDEA